MTIEKNTHTQVVQQYTTFYATQESVYFRIFMGCIKNDLIHFNCSAKITRVRVTFIVPVPS